MVDLGGLSYIGSGISDIFQASGLKQDAASLDKAAGMEDVNAKISEASAEIQQQAAQRDIYKVMGAQQSDIAMAGMKLSGTAQDLIRSSAQQGALTHALIQAQGDIEVQGHEIAAANLRAQAQQARSAASSSMFSGILGIATGVLGLFSDRRLKTDLVRVGTGKRGLPIYRYKYKNDPSGTEWVGYMAQDVEKVDPRGVIDMGVKFIDSEYAPERVNA